MCLLCLPNHLPCSLCSHSDMPRLPASLTDLASRFLRRLERSSEPRLQPLLFDYPIDVPLPALHEAIIALDDRAGTAPGHPCGSWRQLTLEGELSVVSDLQVMLTTNGVLLSVTADVKPSTGVHIITHCLVAMAQSTPLLALAQTVDATSRELLLRRNPYFRHIHGSCSGLDCGNCLGSRRQAKRLSSAACSIRSWWQTPFPNDHRHSRVPHGHSGTKTMDRHNGRFSRTCLLGLSTTRMWRRTSRMRFTLTSCGGQPTWSPPRRRSSPWPLPLMSMSAKFQRGKHHGCSKPPRCFSAMKKWRAKYWMWRHPSGHRLRFWRCTWPQGCETLCPRRSSSAPPVCRSCLWRRGLRPGKPLPLQISAGSWWMRPFPLLQPARRPAQRKRFWISGR